MSRITCRRCKQETPPLPENPYTGALGEEIQRTICPRCWAEWQKFSVAVINEHRLKPFLPEHRAFLEDQMRQFLGLGDQQGQPS